MPVIFEKAHLDNGLTVIGEIDRNAHTASAGFFVKTGARDETAELMGVSHFLEHMMFKGTPNRSADEVNLAFDEMGADYNAYTSAEMTCFYATTLPERYGEAVELLADILRPALREADFDTERGVILEEIAMYRDVPFWNLYEAAMERHYGRHPLGHRVLGTEQTVAEMSAESMRAYFENRYSADNAVLAVAGAVDFDKTVADAERLCGEWNRSGAKRDGAAPMVDGSSFTLRDAAVQRAYMLMLAPAPAVQSEDRYAAMMLAKVLGDSDNSRLHWALAETGLAEEAQAAYDPSDGVGLFYLYASGEPSKADAIWSAAMNELDSLLDSLDESDLERLRNKLATQVTLAGERPSGRMQRIGRLWTYLGQHATLEDELARINAVTLDNLRRVHREFPFSPRTVGRLLPAE